jgi:hypothetical protein
VRAKDRPRRGDRPDGTVVGQSLAQSEMNGPDRASGGAESRSQAGDGRRGEKHRSDPCLELASVSPQWRYWGRYWPLAAFQMQEPMSPHHTHVASAGAIHLQFSASGPWLFFRLLKIARNDADHSALQDGPRSQCAMWESSISAGHRLYLRQISSLVWRALSQTSSRLARSQPDIISSFFQRGAGRPNEEP